MQDNPHTDVDVINSDAMYETYVKHANREEGICVIFGAGASYGYTDEYPSIVPPAVAQLFDDENVVVKEVIRRSEHSFVLGHRDHYMRSLKRYDNDLEKYLSTLYEKNSSDDQFTSLLFYLQDLFYFASDNFHEQNNSYKDLINSLFDRRGKLPWSLITFNYDTLLEKSYVLTRRDRTRTFGGMNEYLQNPKVIKIHGSINFRYTLLESREEPQKTEKDVFGLMMDGKEIEGESTVVYSLGLKSHKIRPFHSEVDERNDKGDYLKMNLYDFPLMMIPIHGTHRSKHEFFAEMLSEAKEQIQNASLVIAIGYNFGDELFLDTIKSLDYKNKELVIVSTSSLAKDFVSHPAFKNVSKVWHGGKINIFNGNGFTEFVEAII